jgi:hypothetical protein
MMKSEYADCRADFSPDEGEKSQEYSVYCKVFDKIRRQICRQDVRGDLRQYRIILVRRLRSQNFRQIV